MTKVWPLTSEIEAAMSADRSTPQAIAPRMALVQLFAVCGQWRRARTQLETIEKIDSECGLIARTYGRLIAAEAVRERVFSGRERPIAFGQPPAWLAMTAEARALEGQDDIASAQALREKARADTPSRSGELNGEAFQWLMDADPRPGAVLEVMIDGQYRWLPLDHVIELRADQPKAMCDLVWQPVVLRLGAGTELPAFVPSWCPGSEVQDDDVIRLCRETRWIPDHGEQRGLGQRLLASDSGDHTFLDIRRLLFDDAGFLHDG